MKIFSYICVALFLNMTTLMYAQTLDKSFQGYWGTTHWQFNFYNDGTLERTSEGHLGNTKIRGKYVRNKDTINIYGSKYLLENDSILIGLGIGYDYKLISVEPSSYNSKKRAIKYPQLPTDNYQTKQDMEKVLNIAFNSKAIKKYYPFEKYPNKKVIIANYLNLVANILIDSVQVTFMPKSEIQEKCYIEFTEINQRQNNIQIQMTIQDEYGIDLSFEFVRKGEEWIQESVSVYGTKIQENFIFEINKSP